MLAALQKTGGPGWNHSPCFQSIRNVCGGQAQVPRVARPFLLVPPLVQVCRNQIEARQFNHGVVQKAHNWIHDEEVGRKNARREIHQPTTKNSRVNSRRCTAQPRRQSAHPPADADRGRHQNQVPVAASCIKSHLPSRGLQFLARHRGVRAAPSTLPNDKSGPRPTAPAATAETAGTREKTTNNCRRNKSNALLGGQIIPVDLGNLSGTQCGVGRPGKNGDTLRKSLWSLWL